MNPTPEQIARLPKWAQEYLKQLESDRLSAVRSLNEYVDDQAESPFRYWDYVNTGEEGRAPSHKTKFIQTNKMEVHWAGIELRVLIRPGQNEIDLQWSKADGSRIEEIAFIPKSFGSAVLKAKENMR